MSFVVIVTFSIEVEKSFFNYTKNPFFLIFLISQNLRKFFSILITVYRSAGFSSKWQVVLTTSMLPVLLVVSLDPAVPL